MVGKTFRTKYLSLINKSPENFPFIGIYLWKTSPQRFYCGRQGNIEAIRLMRVAIKTALGFCM